MTQGDKRSLRLVFFGTPEVAVPTLEALAASRHHVVGVVCQPDRPKGRGRVLMPPPVKQTALTLGIPVVQPEKLKNNPEFMQQLRDWNADACIVMAYGVFLTQEVLDVPPLGFYNAHGSVLPRWRGAAPLNWAILSGDESTGITIQKVRLKFDTGPVALAESVPIGPKDDTHSLWDQLCPIAARLMVEAMDLLADGTIEFVEQDESKVTWAPILKKEDGEIDWSKSAVEIDRQVRGLKPWPGTYTYRQGKMLKIYRATPLDDSHFHAPGSVISVSKNGLEVACGEGSLLIEELQLQGGKCMDARAFLNGCRVDSGESLGRKS